jgi:type II secretory pathway component PulF
MKRFFFRAIDHANQPVSGFIDAEDKAAAFNLLRSRNLFPLDIERDGSIARWLNAEVSTRSARHREIYRIMADLGHLISAGVELPTALGLIENTGTRVDRKLTSTLFRKVRRGDRLSEALVEISSTLPRHVIAIIRAGEMSNSLGESLIQVANNARSTQALRARIVTSLIYPAAVALATLGAIVVLLVVVVPSLEDLFSGQIERLPWQTRALLSLSNAFRENYIALIVSGVIALVLSFFAYINVSTRRAIELAGLRNPLTGPLIVGIETVHVATLLATLTHAKIPIVSALEIVRDGARLSVSRSALSDGVSSVREGRQLHEALVPVEALNRRVLELVRIGEITGKLPELLKEAARDAERHVNAAIDRGLAMLTPIMTLTFGGVAGFVLYSVMTAVMSVNSLVEN